MHSALSHPRIITVDALRGIALFGILLAHMCYWYNAGPLPGEFFGKYTGIVNQVVGIFNDVLISGKFFAFFSFLFGLSFFFANGKDGTKKYSFCMEICMENSFNGYNWFDSSCILAR